ncbi:BRCA1-associated RING domain protein 1 [Cocos nucifera]|uniref:BRCA1-associated RING domain protein 1 n=1 Tax=Cocos nucifera TaxID=13894 RepID=A0A8K0IG63_COCNU|nr:BRCA1-associated RING domain protein 1 [Cocos nucifera]
MPGKCFCTLITDNHGGRIDDPVEDGDTVLHLSCLYGYLPCVQLLLQRGANLESKDEEGAIPLHDACAGGRCAGFIDIVQYIINFSGSPDCVERMLNTTDAEGDTPLHHAARGEHLDVIRLLLAAGASPKKTNAYGKTPAELAGQDTEVQSVLTAAAAAAPDAVCCQ